MKTHQDIVNAIEAIGDQARNEHRLIDKAQRAKAIPVQAACAAIGHVFLKNHPMVPVVGKATLQADLIGPFCKIVGNTIYAEWMAYQIGCTLVQIKSEAERRAEAAEKRAADAELKVRILMETFHVRSST